MRKRLTGFPSKEVADAFVDGMYYANDSALQDIEVVASTSATPRPGDPAPTLDQLYEVQFEDTDYDDDYLDEGETELVLPYQPGNMGA